MFAGRVTEPQAEDFEAVAARIDSVEGWLTLAQAQRLHESTQSLYPGAVIVEIGSFRGRSTIVLASAAPDNSVVLAIDPFGGGDRGPRELAPDAARGQRDYEVFQSNLTTAGVADQVHHVRKRSDAALEDAPSAIDLLFVDGAHRLGAARRDITQWGDRVRTGGTMFVHDAFSSVGVTLALLTSCFMSRRWSYAGRTGSLAEYRRVQMLFWPRLTDAARQAAQLPWFVRNLAIKLLIVAGLGRMTRLLGHSGRDWPY